MDCMTCKEENCLHCKPLEESTKAAKEKATQNSIIEKYKHRDFTEKFRAKIFRNKNRHTP